MFSALEDKPEKPSSIFETSWSVSVRSVSVTVSVYIGMIGYLFTLYCALWVSRLPSGGVECSGLCRAVRWWGQPLLAPSSSSTPSLVRAPLASTGPLRPRSSPGELRGRLAPALHPQSAAIDGARRRWGARQRSTGLGRHPGWAAAAASPSRSPCASASSSSSSSFLGARSMSLFDSMASVEMRTRPLRCTYLATAAISS